MKIAFTGKGGSGRSTLAFRMSRFLTSKGYFVLAVDADHNMDFAYNLDPTFAGPFLGKSREDMLTYADADIKFSLRSPVDPFTDKYSKSINAHMRLMVSGPHTEEVLEGQRCSHSLSASLKKYFPRLKLNPNEAVVVDEKAGSDGVGTGVLRGFDHVFIVTEPTPQSVKASHQIADILEYYRIPYSFVLNKIQDTSSVEELNLRRRPAYSFSFSTRMSNPTENLDSVEQHGFESLSSVPDTNVRS